MRTFLMGYTGFARLGNVNTDQWVADTLVQAAPAEHFEILTQETQKAVAALRQPLQDSGHAFVAVGYGAFRQDPTGRLHATGVIISNAVNQGYGSWNPSRSFQVVRTSQLIGPHDFRVGAVGIVPPRAEAERAIDTIRRYRKHDRTKSLGILQLLVNLIRSVAAQDPRVGPDISVSILPRAAVPASSFTTPVATGLLLDPIQQLSCMFVPGGRDVPQAEVYGPAWVCPGYAMRGAEVWSQKPPWWQD